MGLHLTEKEAQQHLTAYKENIPDMMTNMNKFAKKCLDQGFIEFALGKKRFFYHLLKDMRELRKGTEEYKFIESKILRISKNTKVQGNASIMSKLALLATCKRILDNGWTDKDAWPILVVHDEQVVEAREEIADQVAVIVRESMEEAFQTICPGFPNKVDVWVSDRWIKG